MATGAADCEHRPRYGRYVYDPRDETGYINVICTACDAVFDRMDLDHHPQTEPELQELIAFAVVSADPSLTPDELQPTTNHDHASTTVLASDS